MAKQDITEVRKDRVEEDSGSNDDGGNRIPVTDEGTLSDHERDWTTRATKLLQDRIDQNVSGKGETDTPEEEVIESHFGRGVTPEYRRALEIQKKSEAERPAGTPNPSESYRFIDEDFERFGNL